MACRNCNSNRLAVVIAHSKDLSIFQCAHLDIDKDGYFPDIPGVCDGDDAQFEFCLECGTIQGDTFPITDAQVKSALKDSGYYGEGEEEDDDYEPREVELNFIGYRLDDNSGDEYKTEHSGMFIRLLWVAAFEQKPNFLSWALTIAPEGLTVLLAILDCPTEADFEIVKVAAIPENSFHYNPIEWVVATQYFK